MKKSGLLKFFQRLSRAFLVPMAIIAASSLLMGVASLFTLDGMLDLLPFLKHPGIQYAANLLNMTGSIVMGNLPVIYAIAISFAMSDEDKEYAAFAGFIGYISFITGMSFLINSFPGVRDMFPGRAIVSVLGIETVNVGLVGGIVVALFTAWIHKKFRNIKLPMAFAFFQGVRFVPFACSVFFVLLAQVFPFIWVPISKGINSLASVVNLTGAFGPFLYGTVEKLLIPTGLHQVWNTVIRDTAVSGIYEFASGTVIEGARPAYFQYLVEGLPQGASLVEMVKFLRPGQIPMTVFAAPAIALAMYQCADKDKKDLIKPLLITGAITAAFAGITEPLEFIFLFTAPILFVVYAVLGGISWMVLYILGSTSGGVEANVLGLILYGVLRPEANWWIIVAVGCVQAVINYFLFKWWIIKFNVKTPGRGGDYDDSLAFAAEIANVDTNVRETNTLSNAKITDPKVLKAQIIIKGLGGIGNIAEVDSCMSRLRVEVKDMSQVDEETLKKTGCSGIVKPDASNIQIIYGTTVGLIKNAVMKELQNMQKTL